MEKIIEVKNLRKNFGENEVLHDINLTVNRGEVVSLIGPSGSGKSTILRCIIDLETITSGDILIEGKNLKDKKLKKEIENLQIIEVDERFSTVIADNILKELNKNGAIEKRKVVDKVAASIILQTYLDMKKLKFLEEGKEWIRTYFLDC